MSAPVSRALAEISPMEQRRNSPSWHQPTTSPKVRCALEFPSPSPSPSVIQTKPSSPCTNRTGSRKMDSRRTRPHSNRIPLRQRLLLACFGRIETQKTSCMRSDLVRHHRIVAPPSSGFNEPRASRTATFSLWSRSRNMIRPDCPRLRDPLLRSKGTLSDRPTLVC